MHCIQCLIKTPTINLYQLLFNVLGKSPIFKNAGVSYTDHDNDYSNQQLTAVLQLQHSI